MKGFTVLELLISLAIIGVVTGVSLPTYTSWSIKKNFQNDYKQVIDNLRESRIESSARNTTARILLAGTAGSYTMTLFVSASPTTTCDTTGTWTQVFSRSLDLASRFEITGTGVGNVCFYRDGSASSATYSIAQVDGGSEYGSASIIVTVGTGYLDVTVN